MVIHLKFGSKVEAVHFYIRTQCNESAFFLNESSFKLANDYKLNNWKETSALIKIR